MMSDDMILDIAMHNSYDVITGIFTAEELMESDIGSESYDSNGGCKSWQRKEVSYNQETEVR